MARINDTSKSNAESTLVMADETVVDKGQAKQLLQEVQSGWTIDQKGGGTLHFELLSDIRRAIQVGSIKAGDEVLLPNGSRRLIESYDETADLFAIEKNESEKTEGPEGLKPPVYCKRREIKRMAYRAFVVLAFSSALAASPIAYKELKVFMGKRAVASYVEGIKAISPSDRQIALAKARAITHSSTHYRKIKETTRAYQEVLAANPENAEAILSLADHLLHTYLLKRESKLRNDASNMVAYASTLSPDVATLRRVEGLLQWSKDNRGSAVHALREAVEWNSTDAAAHALLGQMSRERRDDVTAFYHLTRATELAPKNPLYIENLVEFLEKHSKFEEASMYIRRLAELRPENVKHYRRRLLQTYRKAGATMEIQNLQASAGPLKATSS